MVVSRGSAGPNRDRNTDPGKGKRVNIPVPRGYASRQRKAPPRRLGVGGPGAPLGGDPANLPKAGECRNGENRPKGGMARLWRVPPTPGALEKGVGKDPPRPYREPTQVPLGEQPKASGG